MTPSTEHLASVAARPRLRGWLHLWAFGVSVAAGIVLVSVAGATRGRRGRAGHADLRADRVLLFGTSARSTTGCAGDPAEPAALLARLDHSMIFVFIAGTYTPFAVLAMPERTGGRPHGRLVRRARRRAAQDQLDRRARAGSAVPLYLGLGWVAVFVLPSLLQQRRASPRSC